MGVTVQVRDVVQEMDLLLPGLRVYLNRNTGEFVGVSEDDLTALEAEESRHVPAWQEELLPKVREALESEDYVALPDSFDIHEWEIMRDFAREVADAEASDDLLRAVHGRGAFRHFRDTIHRLGLVEEWDRFRDRALERIAIDWLEANGIPYTTGEGEERRGGGKTGEAGREVRSGATSRAPRAGSPRAGPLRLAGPNSR